MIIYGPYMIRYGPCMIIYGQYISSISSAPHHPQVYKIKYWVGPAVSPNLCAAHHSLARSCRVAPRSRRHSPNQAHRTGPRAKCGHWEDNKTNMRRRADEDITNKWMPSGFSHAPTYQPAGRSTNRRNANHRQTIHP